MSSVKQFYHGTSALAAVSISVDGFRLLSEELRNYQFGFLGQGTYVTRSLETALSFSRTIPNFVLEVRLRPGTRVLRLDGSYDSATICSLKREFGKDIVSAEFARCIPKNKQLKPHELISLLNYLWMHGKRDGCDRLLCLYCNSSAVKRYAAKMKYSALGDRESDIGIVVFNPSDVILSRVLAFGEGGSGRPAQPALLAECAGYELESFAKRGASGAVAHEVERWTTCLALYRKRHNLLASTI